MRQAKKEIHDQAIMTELLAACHVGRLGTVGKAGRPMIKPLNFVYKEGKVYFHTAGEGEKIEDIMRDDRVCFEVDLPIALVKSAGSPCRAEYLYRSVIIEGRARIIADQDERLFALRNLMHKYQPEGGYLDFPEEKLRITAVVRIDIETMTGKEDLGDEQMKEAALRALRINERLPIVLMRS